jgi:hypothetical protein
LTCEDVAGEAAVDPADAKEEAWCAARRDDVVQYLLNLRLDHGAVGDVPAWFVAPHIAIWAVESLRSPGWVGWWAISGDLPTDYCSAQDCRHPRLAMRRFADGWTAAIEQTKPEDATIGETGLPVSLLSLLKARADLLFKFSADDDLWAE